MFNLILIQIDCEGLVYKKNSQGFNISNLIIILKKKVDNVIFNTETIISTSFLK